MLYLFFRTTGPIFVFLVCFRPKLNNKYQQLTQESLRIKLYKRKMNFPLKNDTEFLTQVQQNLHTNKGIFILIKVSNHRDIPTIRLGLILINVFVGIKTDHIVSYYNNYALFNDGHIIE